MKRTRVVVLGGRVLLAAAIVVAFMLTEGTRTVAAADNNHVLAEIGSYKITEQQVDDKLKNQFYEARRHVLNEIIDNHLLEQAATKDKLSVADYLHRELDKKVTTDLAGMSAKVDQFYDKNKDKLFKGEPANKAKIRLMAELRQHAVLVEREKLMTKLRKEAGVKILLQQPRVEVATAGRPALGPKDAPVTLVEFGDFQCPFCERAEATLKTIREKYSNKVRLVFIDFPLSIHAHAMQAASAARCAQEQGKFWQYHDALFADQSKLAPADLKATAKKLGLNTKEFDACFDHDKYDAMIQKDMAEGRELGVTGTPTFFINGRELIGTKPLARFQEIIDEELARAGNHDTKKKAGQPTAGVRAAAD